MTNILVTGGGGYIGSHACKVLASRGYTPVVYDNFQTGWSDAAKFGPVVRGDLRDRDTLSDTFRKYRPHAVMHFAALIEVGASVYDPVSYWNNNVFGTHILLDEMLKADCNRLVFSSTCAVNGVQDGTPINEQSTVQPMSPYGATKAAAEQMISDYERAFGLRALRFRYFNVAGADEDAEIGEYHRPETHLVPLILDAAVGKRSEIRIFGDDYPTRDGTCVRDYVHVLDLVDAHVDAIQYLDRNQREAVMCLGTSSGMTVREMIDTVSQELDIEVPCTIESRRAGDPASLVCGSKLAQEELGWTPKRSVPEVIVRDAWKWHRSGHYKN